MKVLRLIKDAFYCTLALASMYVFGAVMFGWPLLELLTPKHEVNTNIVVKAVPVPKPEKPKKDTRLSTCVDEAGQRVTCVVESEIIIVHDDPNDYSKPPLTEDDLTQ